MSVLAVVPTYLDQEIDAELLLRCLVSLAMTAPEAEVVVIDDGSPARHLVAQLGPVCDELGQRLVRKEDNSGFSRTVNRGLELARDEGKHALLVNQDIQFVDPGWLDAMVARTDPQDRPAAVVGAKLLYPNGLLQHAGILHSRLYGWFDHRMRFGPGDLPEANVPAECPVTGALQLIRHTTLEAVGLYDESYVMGFEDVDYCLRTFAAGLSCMYEPRAWALHHESALRGRLSDKNAKWLAASSAAHAARYGDADHSRHQLALT